MIAAEWLVAFEPESKGLGRAIAEESEDASDH